MRIQILQIAATKNKHFIALEAEFEKRLQAFCQLETLTLQASKSDQRERCQQEERDRFLEKIDTKAFLIALDERGKQITSPEFAKLIEKQRDFGPGRIQFLIGGSHGLHPDVREKAHQVLGLSKMTFTHEMIRPFIKEQIYRAFAILAGKTYHK